MEEGLEAGAKEEVGDIVEGVAALKRAWFLVKAETAGGGPLIEDGAVVGNNGAGFVSDEVGAVYGEDLEEIAVVECGNREAGEPGV